MAIYLYIFVPILWLATGKLLGVALAAAFFYSDAGKRRGRLVSIFCAPLLPVVYLVAIFSGGAGNAGHGFTLFGSDTLLTLATSVPLIAVVILGAFAGVVYVVRDLTVGHAAASRQDS